MVFITPIISNVSLEYIQRNKQRLQLAVDILQSRPLTCKISILLSNILAGDNRNYRLNKLKFLLQVATTSHIQFLDRNIDSPVPENWIFVTSTQHVYVVLVVSSKTVDLVKSNNLLDSAHYLFYHGRIQKFAFLLTKGTSRNEELCVLIQGNKPSLQGTICKEINFHSNKTSLRSIYDQISTSPKSWQFIDSYTTVSYVGGNNYTEPSSNPFNRTKDFKINLYLARIIA